MSQTRQSFAVSLTVRSNVTPPKNKKIKEDEKAMHFSLSLNVHSIVTNKTMYSAASLMCMEMSRTRQSLLVVGSTLFQLSLL